MTSRQWVQVKATQCVAFPGIGEGEVELPEILEVGDGDAAAEFVAELTGEIADDLAAVVGAGISTLLFLHDALTDEPVGLHHQGVDRGEGFLPGILENGANVLQQSGRNGGRVRIHSRVL